MSEYDRLAAQRDAIIDRQKATLTEALVNAYIATRTPARPGTPDWAQVRSSLECELFAKAVPVILKEHFGRSG
jgi:hypothetical protein